MFVATTVPRAKGKHWLAQGRHGWSWTAKPTLAHDFASDQEAKAAAKVTTVTSFLVTPAQFIVNGIIESKDCWLTVGGVEGSWSWTCYKDWAHKFCSKAAALQQVELYAPTLAKSKIMAWPIEPSTELPAKNAELSLSC